MTILRDHFVHNGQPNLMCMAPDQGFWPDDATRRRGVELTRAMGVNGLREHQQLEDPRHLSWAARLGLLVRAEMPTANRITRTTIRRTVREWTEAIERDHRQPWVIVRVPFNGSWGVSEPTEFGGIA